VFSGFGAPIDNPPVINAVKAGQILPVKFGLGEFVSQVARAARRQDG
jgi:hypothetical protein